MNITTANFGWYAAVFLIAGLFLGEAWGWLAGRYGITRHGRFRFGVTRRWYGTRAHVCLRSAADDDDPDRFQVLEWEDENTAVPWLKVHKLNPEFLTYWAEDAEAFWAPVTDFAPYSVRCLRPWVDRRHGLPVPSLFSYWPPRQPADYLEGA